MSTAVQICAEAYRRANLDQELTSFSTTQDFPYNNALSIIKDVVKDMNRWGNYRSMFATQSLTYSGGTYTYDLSSYTPYVEPLRIIRVYRSLTNYQGKLEPYQWETFWNAFRRAAMVTTTPTAWSWHGNTLELNTIPDQDYTMVIEHYRDIPVPTITTSTFGNWPTHDEDVLIDGVYAMLLQQMGRQDFQVAYQLWKKKAEQLLADQKQPQSIPFQMPAGF